MVGAERWLRLWLAFGLLTAGCSGDDDDDSSSGDAPPTASIEAPASGTSIGRGATVTLSGRVDDDVDPSADLAVVWKSSIDGELSSGHPDSQGRTAHTTTALSEGSHQITLTATDSGGHSTVSDPITLEVTANTAPKATLASPGGNSFVAGQRFTLSGTVSDGEDSPAALEAQFITSKGDILSAVLTPDGSGKVTAEVSIAKEGTHDLALSVTDSGGQLGRSNLVRVQVTKNLPPVVSLEPLDEPVVDEGSPVTLTATVDDDVTAEDALVLTWTSSELSEPLDCPEPAEVDGGVGTVTCVLEDLPPGDHLITLTATDSGNATGDDDLELTINGAPGLPEISLTPARPGTNDPLKVSLTRPSSDPNGDKVTYGYRWFRNNSEVGALTADSVPASSTERGEVWKVVVTPTDGRLDGESATAQVTIVNTPPTVNRASISPDTGYISSTFSCEPDGFTDVDGDREGYRYEWLIEGVVVAGATGATYVPSSHHPGEELACRAIPTDGTDEGAGVTSTAIVIDDRPPSVVKASITPATGGEASTFACVPGGFSDPDGDEAQFFYKWYVNGLAGPATATLTGESFRKSDRLECEITPYDGLLTGSPVKSSSVTVTNTPPTVTSLALVPDPAYADSSLRCQTVGYQDLDGDAEKASFTWKVDNVTVEPATSGALTGVFTKGQTVECAATISDGDSSTTAQSLKATIQISNKAPSITSVALSPSAGNASTEFKALPKGWYDPDDATVSYTYQWYINGVASVTTETIKGQFKTDDRLKVTVTPKDGEASGTPVTSSEIVIGSKKNPPSIESVELNPATAREKDTLTCTAKNVTDPENDSVTFTYAWAKVQSNGSSSPISGATAKTLTGSSFSKGDRVTCDVTPTDSTGEVGSTVTSNVVEIDNTPPKLTSAAITPTRATRKDTLTCTPSGYSDDDGDANQPRYAWKVNGTTVANVSGNTLSNAYFKANDQVTCTVTPNDGEDDGTAVTSAAVTIVGVPPSCTSATLSSTSSPAVETSTLTCQANGCEDADLDQISLTYAWLNKGTLISGQSGTSLTGSAFSRGDSITCRVTPSAGGDTGTAVTSNALDISNSAPVMKSVALNSSPTPAVEGSTLTCAASATDADGDSLTYEYSWTVAGKALSVPTTTASITGQYFNKGDQVTCSVKAKDTAGGTSASSTSDAVLIQNSLPVVSTAVLTPDPAYKDSLLTCTATGTDDDAGTTVTFLYEWYVNNTKVSGATSRTLSGKFVRDDQVRCQVTPVDDSGLGTAKSSNVVTVANSKPVVGDPTLAPDPAREADTLQCTAATGSDVDGDGVSIRYAWKVNNVTVSGATASTLTGASFNRGDSVVCVTTPYDGREDGVARSSNAVTIENTSPSISSVTLSPSPAFEASSLACAPSTATDPDPGDSPTLTYRWTVNGTTVSGAATSTLTGASFTKNDQVKCLVTPRDGFSTGTEVGSNTVTVQNTAPVVSGVSITTASPKVGSTLTCAYTAATDDDDEDKSALTITYAWKVNGSTLSNASASTLSGRFVKNDQVQCVVTAKDKSNASTSSTSTAVTIGNTAPSVANVSLTPTDAFEKSTLVCGHDSPTDADTADSPTVTYAWKVNGSTVSGASTATLTGASFTKNDQVQCVVTPTDGSSTGTAVTSSAVTIKNTAPVVTGVSVGPASPKVSSTLTCSYTSATDDDDEDKSALTITYAWKVNGSTLSNATASTLSNRFGKNDQVQCVVTAKDKSNATTSGSSNTVTIGNSTPSVANVSLTPSVAYEKTTLTCTHDAPTDADNGDSPTVTYAWRVNGSLVSGAGGATLTGASFTKRDEVQCEVTPTDGSSTGTPVASNTVSIQNTSPVVTGAGVGPASPKVTSTLTCSYTSAVDDDDEDKSALTITYAWKVNGSTVTGETAATLAGEFVKNDQVQCIVTARDKSNATGSSTSSQVVIGNSPPTVSGVTISPASPFAGQVLTANHTGATDPDNESVTLTYAWRRDGSLVSGLTTATVPANTTQAGESWTVTITPVDADSLAGTAVTSSPVTIQAAPDNDGDGFTTVGGDCDDGDDTIYPNAPELKDGEDNDCNSAVDDRWPVRYTYGDTPDESFGEVGSDTAIAVEADGRTHLFFGGFDADESVGADLHTANGSSATDFAVPTGIDDLVTPAYHRLSLWERASLATQVRTLVYDQTLERLRFRNFNGSIWQTSIDVTGAGVVTDGAAIVTAENGTDYVIYSELGASCGAGQDESGIALMSRAATGTAFGDYTQLELECGPAGPLGLSNPALAIAEDTGLTVLHAAWYSDLDTAGLDQGLYYLQLEVGAAVPTPVLVEAGLELGRYSAVAADPNDPNSAILAWLDPITETIVVGATFDGSSFFTLPAASPAEMAGSVPSEGRVELAVDGAGNPHVLFAAENGTELWYVTFDDLGNWAPERVLTGAGFDIAQYSLKLDADGNPRIAVHHNGDLKYLRGKMRETTLTR